MKEKALYERVGANIRRIRQKKGLTLQALADIAGMEKSNLIPMEKGRTNMTLGTLHRLAEALEVDPREFFRVGGA